MLTHPLQRPPGAVGLALAALTGLFGVPAQAQTGQATLTLGAHAYHDDQNHNLSGNASTVLTDRLFADDTTGAVGTGYDYASHQWAEAFGRVTPTVLQLSSQVYAWTRSTGPAYAAFASASANAYVQVPFFVPALANAPAGSQGTAVVPLHITGDVWADDPLYVNATGLELRGQAHFHAWATGLQATGCPYYTDAACRNIVADSQGKAITGNAPFRTWTLNIPVTFGAWSSFSLQMWTSAGAYANAPGDGSWQQYGAWSNAAHSMRWGGIQQILNAQGQALSGWTVESLPGVDLTVSAVPEPQSLALWLAGLGLLRMAVRRRRPQP